MLNTNPFAELSAMIDPTIMETYVILMALLVAGGTLFDIVHKRSAQYFFNNWQKSKANAKRQVSGAEKASVAVKTAIDGLTSAELGDCSTRRQLAHILTMYGFIAYTVTTAMMVFGLSGVCNAGHCGQPLVLRRLYGVCWRLLVLVLYPG